MSSRKICSCMRRDASSIQSPRSTSSDTTTRRGGKQRTCNDLKWEVSKIGETKKYLMVFKNVKFASNFEYFGFLKLYNKFWMNSFGNLGQARNDSRFIPRPGLRRIYPDDWMNGWLVDSWLIRWLNGLWFGTRFFFAKNTCDIVNMTGR